MLAGVSLLAAVLAVAALLFGAWSGRRANQAARQARLALARQLAADSLNQLDSNNDLAWLLAIEGGRRGETVETFSALRRAIAHPGHTLTILSGHDDKVNQAVWNADESRGLAQRTVGFDDDGVDGADALRGFVDPVEQSHRRLLVRHGHVATAEAERDQPRQRVLQPFGRNRERHIGAADPVRVQPEIMDHRRSRMDDRHSDDAG